MSTESFRERTVAFREREILAVATELLRERGCRAFAMHDVAERLGTSKGTIYRHFRGREDLIRLCVAEGCRKAFADARAAEGGEPRLETVVRVLVRRCLGLDGPDAPPPCCLLEADCPFLDWEEMETFLRGLGAARVAPGVELAAAIRALAASTFRRRRRVGRSPSEDDAEAIARFVLRDRPGPA